MIFKKMRIQTKLLTIYLSVFAAIFLSYGTIEYYLIRKSISAGIERELQNTTELILGMVQSSTDATIRSYLRAVAEKNYDIVESYYRRFRQGEITEQEAWNKMQRIILTQTIGKTGYLYCLNKKGTVMIHPKRSLIGSTFSHIPFVQKQMKLQDDYVLYEWKNPGEDHERAKALYMVYFKPWDLIISAATYREEFRDLIRIEDFRDKILGIKFGITGYSYIVDGDGNLLIHPYLKGNYRDARDSNGRPFLREMLANKNGKIIYSWKNPDEKIARDKLVLYNYIPELDWIVASSSYIDEFYQPLSTLRKVFIAGFIITLVILVIVNIALSRYITAPLFAIVEKLKTAGSGDYTVRMSEQSNDELGDMARYFNIFIGNLAELKKKDEQLIRIQKMEAVWQLTGGLAHDFNNMLGGIMGSVSLLQYYARKGLAENEDKIISSLNTIENATLRASDMVHRLLVMSRKNDIQAVPVNLSLSIRNVISICNNTFDKQVTIDVHYPPDPLWTMADACQLEQVILNLCINAEQAMTIMHKSPEKWGGTLTIDVSRVQGDKYLCELYPEARIQPYAVLEIRDTGIGMNRETIARIFDPFFTTKEAGKGTGLGLSIVYTIISQLGGFISVYSHPGQGTAFKVFLPEIARKEEISLIEIQALPDISGTGLVLVIDDEEIIRNTAQAILSDNGYRVLTAPGGQEGLDIFRENFTDIDAVLLDMAMPGMNGREVFIELKKIDPHVTVILSSGLRQEGYISKVMEMGIFDFLHKPYSMTALLEKVVHAIRR